jgi:hypothetical protein
MIPGQRRTDGDRRAVDRRDLDLLVARLEAAPALGLAQLPRIRDDDPIADRPSLTGRSSTRFVCAARASPASRAKVGVLTAPCIRIGRVR